MIYLAIYLLVVFIFIFIDAMSSIVARRRYRFWMSVSTSLIFPISASLVIWFAVGATRDFKDPEGYIAGMGDE